MSGSGVSEPRVPAPTLDTRARSGNALWWSVLAGLCLALLTPLALTEVPPLLDYPNHLARLYVLAFGNDPALARFYAPRWGIIPNLALDVTVPPLLRLFPVHLVGRAMVGLCLLLPVLGAAAWSRAVHGRLSFWSLGVVLFAWNAAMLRGFLNFTAAAGLALLLAAAWAAWREKRPAATLAMAMAGAVALFFCHLIGLVFFAILLGACEAERIRHDPLWFRAVVRRGLCLAVVFAAPVVLYALSDLGHLSGGTEFRSVLSKARTAVTPVVNYWWPLDLATAAACVTVFALCLVRGWRAVPFQGGLALAVLLALFLGLPHAYKETFDLDTRFIILAAFLAPAVLPPLPLALLPLASRASPGGRGFFRASGIVGLGFLALFGARMGVLMSNWTVWAGEVAGFRAVIGPVRAGDVVLMMRLPRDREPSAWTLTPHPRYLSDGTWIDSHLPALLVIEHHAWWPYLFDNLSQQPIATREPYRGLGDRIDTATNPLALLDGDTPERRLVSHVLVLGEGAGMAGAGPEGLELIRRNDAAALYWVERR